MVKTQGYREAMMRITLLRHGQPKVKLAGNVRASELGDLARSYDQSGILDTPPPDVLLSVRNSRCVVCSPLARSVESARALGFPDIQIMDPLYVETAIPHFTRGAIALPVRLWVPLLRLLWLFGFSRNGESLVKARKRAREAAIELTSLADEQGDILLVGHGFMNHFIAGELRKMGWTGPSRPGHGHWGYGVYERAAD